MKLTDKALAVIEGMASLTEPEDGMLCSFYKYAHIGLGHCKNKHEDWVEELEETYQMLKKRGVI